MHDSGGHADSITNGVSGAVSETQKIRLGIAETIFGLSWFLMDGGWLMGWRFLSYPLIVIAVASAVARFLWLEQDRVARHTATSECAWLAMNSFWVVGDFEGLSWCVTTAKFCLLAGVLILARAFMISRHETKELLFRPIKRLRLMFHTEPRA